jgi:hypothetical protein
VFLPLARSLRRAGLIWRMKLVAAGLAALATAAGGSRCAAEESLWRSLLDEGLEVAPGTAVRLEPPLVADGMTAAEQTAAIRGLVGDDWERFVKPGVTARFEFRITKACDLPAGGSVQRLDLWFIGHGSLATVEDGGLIDDLLATRPAAEGEAAEPAKPAEPAEEGENRRQSRSRELSADELRERNLTAAAAADGGEVSYALVDLALINKVRVTGICRGVRMKTPESLTAAVRLDERFLDDPTLPARWFPLLRDEADGVLREGRPQPYAVAAAYAKATRLAEPAGAMLVEVHVVFAEPQGWFDGRNLLRTKLPPLLQQSVQSFRRKLRAER